MSAVALVKTVIVQAGERTARMLSCVRKDSNSTSAEGMFCQP